MTPKVETPRMETYFEAVTALLSASDRLRRHLAKLVEPHAITLQQYNVLRVLRGAGGDGLPTMEVRDRMIERAPGITRLIDRLEEKGLVERRLQDADRRAVTCLITRRGLQLLSGLDAAMDRADRSAFERISEKQIQSLCRVLERIAPEPG